MAKEVAHEKISTFLVASDKVQASSNEIREALESSNLKQRRVPIKLANPMSS